MPTALEGQLASIPRVSRYVFPAPTQTRHINPDSFKDMHEAAIKASQVKRFVVYSLRHTAITRIAVLGLDAHALMYWAGPQVASYDDAVYPPGSRGHSAPRS